MNIRLIILVFCLLFSASSPALADFDVQKAYRAWIMVSQIENREGIPPGLLHSISLVETGRGLNGSILPWPYTIGVNSPGYKKFTTREEMEDTLKYYSNLGFEMFDVEMGNKELTRAGYTESLEFIRESEGVTLMRFRPHHFSEKFPTKKQASEFANNLLQNNYDNFDVGMMQINWHYHKDGFEDVYQALDVYWNANYAVSYLQKHRKNRTWWESVGRYHSGTEEYAKRYIRNVWNMYKKIHKIKA
jgi:hypothetical protein